MLTWIKSLFFHTDRATVAASRIALAFEDMAAMSEACRDEMRSRLAGGGKELPAAGEDEPAKKKR